MANNSHSFAAYFKRATSPLAVLHLLLEQPMYGYEISQAVKRRSNGGYTIDLPYPILYRLEEQGYIVALHAKVIDNRVRNYYAITEEGKQYLLQSLQAYQEMHHIFMALTEE